MRKKIFKKNPLEYSDKRTVPVQCLCEYRATRTQLVRMTAAGRTASARRLLWVARQSQGESTLSMCILRLKSDTDIRNIARTGRAPRTLDVLVSYDARTTTNRQLASPMISYDRHDCENCSTRTITKHARSVVTKA